jgi:ribonuclease Z
VWIAGVFLFSEKKRERSINKEALERYSIPVAELRGIKKGADWVNEAGETIPNETLSRSGPPELSYAYCTDTAPLESLSNFLSAPDLLYHESTFLEEHAKRAKQTHHSTAKQAAQIAEKVKAKYLLLGHYSTRYLKLAPLLEEAQAVFEHSVLSEENHVYKLKAGQGQLTIEKV